MEDFVSFEIAKKLKEKGFSLKKTEIYGKFDSDGLFHPQLYFNYIETMDYDEIDAPTISQVLKWLRKEKHLHIELVAAAYGYNYIVSQTPEDGGTDYYSSVWEYAGPNDGGAWDSDEQAALSAIEYVLNNLI